MGSIVTGLSYYLIGDWRVITITLCLIPCAILLILTILYIEETPKFLIEKNIDKAIKSLNRIGKINNQANLVTIKEV